MDIDTLTNSLVKHLSPALPYLLESGNKITEGANRQIGAELVKEVWSKLGSIVTTNTLINRAAKRVAENPSKEDAKASLRLELEELLSNNQELASELSEIINHSTSSTEVDNRSGGFYGNSITIKGDAAGHDMTKEIKPT